MTEVISAELKHVAATVGTIPPPLLPELVFAGKSNVGKSSLINTLAGRKKLARTSSEPGKTRTINFYLINEQCYFVDLPGYGYAKVSREEQERFSKVIDHYLTHRDNIRGMFLLVDIRHEPSANDKEMAEWMLHYGYTPIVIATKSDKLSKAQIARALPMIRKSLRLPSSAPVLPFSALNRTGTEAIRDVLTSCLQS